MLQPPEARCAFEIHAVKQRNHDLVDRRDCAGLRNFLRQEEDGSLAVMRGGLGYRTQIFLPDATICPFVVRSRDTKQKEKHREEQGLQDPDYESQLLT